MDKLIDHVEELVKYLSENWQGTTTNRDHTTFRFTLMLRTSVSEEAELASAILRARLDAFEGLTSSP